MESNSKPVDNGDALVEKPSPEDANANTQYHSNISAMEETNPNEIAKTTTNKCSKAEAISTVTSWYRDEFWKYLGNKGMLPLRECHEEIIKQLQMKIQQSIPKDLSKKNNFNIIWEYWEEIQKNLLLELAHYDAIISEVNKAEQLSVNQYFSTYEEGMIKFLQTRITRSEVHSLENEILKADADYLNDHMAKIDENCHKILKPHFVKDTREKLSKILGVLKILNAYNDVVNVYFENFICFADVFFENVHRNATKRALEELSLNRDSLKSLDNHVLSMVKQNYEEDNKDIRQTETEAIFKVLEKADEVYMNEILSTQVYNISDIKLFHDYLTGTLIQAVGKVFDVNKRGFNISWLKSKLHERLALWITSNDRKAETSLKFMNRAISESEMMFKEGMKIELLNRTLPTLEFELVCSKRKSEALQHMESKLRDSLPSGRQKQIRQLENQINKLGEEFKTENNKKYEDKESRRCQTPILLIDFGVQTIQVGYVDGVLKTCSFDNLKRVKNFVTFTTSGEYLVGKSSPEKFFEIYTEKLLLMKTKGIYPDKVTLPVKMVEIPINLQFISTLIFTFIRESIEVNNIEFPSVVVTVPLWVATCYRLDIKNAAIVAGFKNVFLVNDLSAAALTYYYRERPISISSSLERTDIQGSPPILIVSADNEVCYAGLFQKKKADGEITVMMLYSLGSFHLQPAKDIHLSLITHMVGVYPNIGQVMICSSMPDLETHYGNLVQSKIPSCTNFMAIENVVLLGAAKYAEMLADKISAAKTSLHDKTFYHLLINDNSNGELMKRNSNLNMYVDSRHTIDTTGRTQLCIYETADGKSRLFVENLIYDGKKGDKIQITCSSNHEGYFDVHTSNGLLLLKEERQKRIAEHTHLIDRYFKRDKEFEMMRKSLTDAANNMLENIEKVPGIMRETIQEECQEALLLAKQLNAQKELVQEKVAILEKFMKRFYDTSK